MQENAVESKSEMCLKICVYAMVDAGDDSLQWHAKLLWLKALFIFINFSVVVIDKQFFYQLVFTIISL